MKTYTDIQCFRDLWLITLQLPLAVTHKNGIDRLTLTQLTGCLCQLGLYWSIIWVYLTMVWAPHLDLHIAAVRSLPNLHF